MIPTLRDRLDLYRQRLGDKEKEGFTTDRWSEHKFGDRLEKNKPK